MTTKKQQAEIRSFLLPLSHDDNTGTVFLLFSQNQVVEILGRRQVCDIPCSQPYLRGVIPYHDKLLPVIDLRPLCGKTISGKAGDFIQLVILRTKVDDPVTGEHLKVAVIADKRVRLARFSEQILTSGFSEQEAPASLKASNLLEGFYRRNNNSLAVVDLSSIVSGAY